MLFLKVANCLRLSHLVSDFRELLSEFGARKYFSKCLTKSTKQKEINGEYTHFITLIYVHHNTRFDCNIRNIKENIAKFLTSVRGLVS